MLAFLIPVALCVSVNTIAFVFILRSLIKSGSKITSTKKTSRFEQARRGAAISVYLGLTWISGFLAIGDVKLVFQYLFCIFNSLQGFLIFLFYCVFSTEVRAKYRSQFCNETLSNPTNENPISLTSEVRSLEMKQQDGAYLRRDRIRATPVRIIVMENIDYMASHLNDDVIRRLMNSGKRQSFLLLEKIFLSPNSSCFLLS